MYSVNSHSVQLFPRNQPYEKHANTALVRLIPSVDSGSVKMTIIDHIPHGLKHDNALTVS